MTPSSIHNKKYTLPFLSASFRHTSWFALLPLLPAASSSLVVLPIGVPLSFPLSLPLFFPAFIVGKVPLGEGYCSRGALSVEGMVTGGIRLLEGLLGFDFLGV